MPARRPLRGFVFRNLHQPGVVWSIRDKAGIVICHSETVIVKAAKFVVNPAGQTRTRRERKKYVHAGVRGEIVIDVQQAMTIYELLLTYGRAVFYNPYENDTFVNMNGEALSTAAYVLLMGTPRGKSKVIYIAEDAPILKSPRWTI